MKTWIIFWGIISAFEYVASPDPELVAVVISEDNNDILRRYGYSAQINNIQFEVLEIEQPWRQPEVALYTDGGHKVNVLKENIGKYAEADNLIILFTDSANTVFLNESKEIVNRFKSLQARVVFSADDVCWPDNSLKSCYPFVEPQEKRFINAGAFMGYAKDLIEIVNYRPINDMESDQLYYTEIFLNKQLRTKWNIKLDTMSTIFQNALFAKDTVVLESSDHNYIYNSKTTTRPIVIYGDGPIKNKPEEARFLRLADYLLGAWVPSKGCIACNRSRIDLHQLGEGTYPEVLLAIFINQPTPFLKEALELIARQDYPKSKIDLFIFVLSKYHDQDVERFTSSFGRDYKSLVVIDSKDKMDGTQSRHWALEMCEITKCPYLFVVEGHVHLTDAKTLQDLMEHNRSIVAPLLTRPGKLWSNFWGGLDSIGYYGSSEDYVDLVEFNKKGLWNVPHINSVYLINGSIISQLQGTFIQQGDRSYEMSFANNLRNKGIFMYISNTKERGYLINCDSYDTSHLHNDLWQIFDNPQAWEKRYLHENYSKSLEPSAVIETPCNDVVWFPIVSEEFCDHMIEEVENNGKWHDGSNEDPRIQGGYENVPTVDIHMNQIGFDDEWLHFLKMYASPLQQKFFIGYARETPRSLMNFVVRYRPDEQPELRPHHDSSTWTINIALNTPGVDFTGGGSRFIRQNCSVTDTKKGWMIMHPGRLTHYHEGLKTISGTRYIMVSFVDP